MCLGTKPTHLLPREARKSSAELSKINPRPEPALSCLAWGGGADWRRPGGQQRRCRCLQGAGREGARPPTHLPSPAGACGKGLRGPSARRAPLPGRCAAAAGRAGVRSRGRSRGRSRLSGPRAAGWRRGQPSPRLPACCARRAGYPALGGGGGGGGTPAGRRSRSRRRRRGLVAPPPLCREGRGGRAAPRDAALRHQPLRPGCG